MHVVLLIFEKPASQSDSAKKIWRSFLDSSEAIVTKAKKTRTLSSNAWLIHLEPDLPTAQELCRVARESGLKYEALGFATIPQAVLLAIDPFA